MKRVEEGGKGREMTRKYIREATEKKISVTVRNGNRAGCFELKKHVWSSHSKNHRHTQPFRQTPKCVSHPGNLFFFFSFETQNTFIGIHLTIYTLFLPPSLTSLCLSVSLFTVCCLTTYLCCLSVFCCLYNGKLWLHKVWNETVLICLPVWICVCVFVCVCEQLRVVAGLVLEGGPTWYLQVNSFFILHFHPQTKLQNNSIM